MAIDYSAYAKQYGGTLANPQQSNDFAAKAAQFGGTQTQQPVEQSKQPSGISRVAQDVGNFFTGSTQAFGRTLGTAASVVSPQVREMRQAATLAPGTPGAELQDKTFRRLMQLAKDQTKTPEQRKKALEQLQRNAQEQGIDVFNNPEYQKTAQQIYGEALGTVGEVAGFGRIGSGAKGMQTAKLYGGALAEKLGGKAAPSITGLGTSGGFLRGVAMGAESGAALGAVQGASEAMQQGKSPQDIYLSTYGGALFGGALGAAGGGVGSFIEGKLAAAGIGGKQKVKDVRTNISQKEVDNLNPAIEKTLEKAIRPSVAGKKTFKQNQEYLQKGSSAVRAIVANKGNLQFTDETGEIVKGGLPQNLRQFTEAIDQTKKRIFQEYNAMAQKAGEASPQINLTGIADELDNVANNPVLQDIRPEVAKYTANRAELLRNRGSYTPEMAQDAIQTMNQSLEAFYRNPTYEAASKAYIDSLIANRMRKDLDSTIEQFAAPGYQKLKNLYGALRTMETDVNKRAIVDARKNTKGLLDFTDVFSGGDIVNGIMTLNPALIAKGTFQKGAASYYKRLNDPNRMIKTMFQKTDKVLENARRRGVIKDGADTVTKEALKALPAAGQTTLGTVNLESPGILEGQAKLR